MKITYRIGLDRHVLELDRYAGPLLAALADTLAAEVAQLDIGALRQSPPIQRDALVRAVGAMVDKLDRESDLLFRAYSVSHAYVAGARSRGSFGRGGGMSGVLLPDTPEGYEYGIHYWVGKCIMQKLYRPPGMKGEVVETIDIRKEDRIPTANVGEIRIHRKRINSTIRAELARLRDFLMAHPPGSMVEKVGQEVE